jgi:leader peptidase (prepilin peptidase) / N-methyltransferase
MVQMGTARLVLEAFAFALGAALGSFANVVIYRLPRRESLVVPGSHCPHCQAPIRAYDNIPILSYLVLRGRCRSCRAPIAVRYVLVETAAGVLLAGLVWQYGVSVATLRFAVLALTLLVVFFIDLEWNIIPNVITYPGILLGLILSGVSGMLPTAAVACLGAGSVFLLVGILSRGGMGGGDIKLAAMIGAYLGVSGVVVALFLAVAIGAGAGLLLIALRLRTRKDMIPFGPALAVGALIAVFASDVLVRWYLTRVL